MCPDRSECELVRNRGDYVEAHLLPACGDRSDDGLAHPEEADVDTRVEMCEQVVEADLGASALGGVGVGEDAQRALLSAPVAALDADSTCSDPRPLLQSTQS